MSKSSFLQTTRLSTAFYYFLHLSGGENGGGLFLHAGKHMLRVNILAYQRGSLQQ